VLELKIKCPSDILTSYSNSKTKILFKFKPEHNKYTLIKKTKEFFLEEINTFNNELIHFFNIGKNNSCIFIYLEFEGNKYKQENNQINYYKLLLNDIRNEKREIICSLFEQAEIKFLIRVIKNKKEKTIKFNDTNTNEDNNIKIRNRFYTQLNGISNFNTPGLSFKDKIKIFNGEFIKKKIYRNENIPGKLKIPEIFLPKKNDKENNVKKEKDEDKKE
jgi:hypothetical protein